MFLVYIYTSVVTFVLMALMPLILDFMIPLNETRSTGQLVFAAKYPIDEEKYYTWLMTYSSFAPFVNLTVMFSCESMFAITTQHVCGMFAIVRLSNC